MKHVHPLKLKVLIGGIFGVLGAAFLAPASHSLSCQEMTEAQTRDWLQNTRHDDDGNTLLLQGRFRTYGNFVVSGDQTVMEDAWFYGAIDGVRDQELRELKIATTCWMRSCGSQELAPPTDERVAIATRATVADPWVVSQSADYCSPGFFDPQLLDAGPTR